MADANIKQKHDVYEKELKEQIAMYNKKLDEVKRLKQEEAKAEAIRGKIMKYQTKLSAILNHPSAKAEEKRKMFNARITHYTKQLNDLTIQPIAPVAAANNFLQRMNANARSFTSRFTSSTSTPKPSGTPKTPGKGGSRKWRLFGKKKCTRKNR